MIDRTTFDLRIAEHSATTARANDTEWQHNQPTRRPIRTLIANALVTLATRLDPTSAATRQPAPASSATPA
jgi:hypothetical protein